MITRILAVSRQRSAQYEGIRGRRLRALRCVRHMRSAQRWMRGDEQRGASRGRCRRVAMPRRRASEPLLSQVAAMSAVTSCVYAQCRHQRWYCRQDVIEKSARMPPFGGNAPLCHAMMMFAMVARWRGIQVIGGGRRDRGGAGSLPPSAATERDDMSAKMRGVMVSRRYVASAVTRPQRHISFIMLFLNGARCARKEPADYGSMLMSAPVASTLHAMLRARVLAPARHYFGYYIATRLLPTDCSPPDYQEARRDLLPRHTTLFAAYRLHAAGSGTRQFRYFSPFVAATLRHCLCSD